MSACPDCHSTLPANYAGLTCPACKGRLPVSSGNGTTGSPPGVVRAVDSVVSEVSVRGRSVSEGTGSVPAQRVGELPLPDRTGMRRAVRSSSSSTTSQRPVLASDVLREDLVPHEPGARAMRWVFAVAGAELIASALAAGMLFSSRLVVQSVPGVTALVVALLPMKYASRALLAFAPALPALAIQGLAVPGVSMGSALLYTVVSMVLPAALLFRARFRASRRARGFVAVAVVLGLAWVLHPRGGALLEPVPSGVSWVLLRLPALSLTGVLLLSLLAFMGMNTTGGCRAWASMAVVWSGTVVLCSAWSFGRWGLGLLLAAADAIALTAVASVALAALLSVYARPSEPRTGIGVAATQGRVSDTDRTDRSGARSVGKV